jgi:hypothetical protein
MKPPVLTYYLLRYVHSEVLEEVFNVGILFVLHQEKKVVFKYPQRLSRIKNLYNGFSTSLIRTYLQSFEKKAKDLSRQGVGDLFPFEAGPEDFLVRDSSSLRFSEAKHVHFSQTDTKWLVDEYFRLYFSDYHQELTPKSVRHDDAYLLRYLEQQLKAKDDRLLNRLRHNVTVRSTATALKFELQWQNGTTNLVKTLGLDLKSEAAIKDKSLLIYGKLDFLKEKAIADHLRYDLIVSHPREHKLFPAYDQALDIIHQSTAPKQIVTEDQLDTYLQKIVETAR